MNNATSWTDEVTEVALAIEEMRTMARHEGWSSAVVSASVAREMAHVESLYGKRAALGLASLVSKATGAL